MADRLSIGILLDIEFRWVVFHFKPDFRTFFNFRVVYKGARPFPVDSHFPNISVFGTVLRGFDHDIVSIFEVDRRPFELG